LEGFQFGAHGIAGIEVIFISAALTQTIWILPLTSSSQPPGIGFGAPDVLAEEDLRAGDLLDFEADVSCSSSRAGFRYSRLTLRTTKAMPGSRSRSA
jgi:hypothetical protein